MASIFAYNCRKLTNTGQFQSTHPSMALLLRMVQGYGVELCGIWHWQWIQMKQRDFRWGMIGQEKGSSYDDAPIMNCTGALHTDRNEEYLGRNHPWSPCRPGQVGIAITTHSSPPAISTSPPPTHSLASICLQVFLTPIKEDGRKNFWGVSHLPSSCILIMPVQLSFPAIFSFSLACVLNIFYTLPLSSSSLTQLALLLSRFDCHSCKQPAFVSLEKNLWYVDCTLLLLWHRQCETGPGHYHIVQTCQIYLTISRRLSK